MKIWETREGDAITNGAIKKKHKIGRIGNIFVGPQKMLHRSIMVSLELPIFFVFYFYIESIDSGAWSVCCICSQNAHQRGSVI